MLDILPLVLCLQPALDATKMRQLAVIITALLTMTGRVTMLGLARWSEKGGSYRTVQRFFATTLPWLHLGWLFFRCHLWDKDDTYLLAGDETIVSKSGKQTHGLGRVFSSVWQKTVPGLSFFVLSLVSLRQRCSSPLLTEQVIRSAAEKKAAAERTATRRQQAQKRKNRSPKPPTKPLGKRGRPAGSKNQRGVDAPLNEEMTRIAGWVKLLLGVVREVLQLRYLVLDGHFGNAGGYALARAVGLELISKLRYDAALYETYEGEQKKFGVDKKYGAKVDYANLPEQWLVSRTEADGYRTEKYHLPGVWQKKFGVPVNVVVIMQLRLHDGACGRAVLFSSDLGLGWEQVEEYYRLRFQIEFNFREAKQHWGLEDFMVQGKVAVGNAASLSLFMVLVSQVLLGAKRGVGEESGVSDVKSEYRGRRYVLEMIKKLGEKAEGIKIGEVCAAVGRLGKIHQGLAKQAAA